VRIKRVLARDTITKKEVEARIKNQWSDDVKSELADFVIENLELDTTKKRVNEAHLFVLKNVI